VVNGSCTAAVSSSAGVTVTVIDNYCVVSFTSTAAATTWTVPSGVTSIEYLVVAGGGQGGTDRGGGGGGGGVITGTISSPAGSYVMKVGAGGNTATGGWGTYVTADGDSSTVTSGGSQIIYAPGGGAGGSNGCAVTVARAGGSGGGGGMACNSGRAGGSVLAGTFPAGGTGYGYSGGSSLSSSDSYRATAGGGGAGGAGGAGACIPTATCPAGATGGSSKPNGGAGIANSITGTSTYYGGGGGGSVAVHSGECSGPSYYSAGPGVGGSSIGGNGGSCTNMNGGVGTINTGSGGGGSGCCSGSLSGSGNSGAAGGSGIIVVKYLKPITITIPQISHKLKERGSFTMDTATVSSGSATYEYSGTSNCTGTTSGRTITVSFSTSGTCIITATASSSPSTKASTTFQIVPNITQKLISRTGIQPNALSSYIPPPYLSTSETYTVTSCVSIVGATGADLLSSTNLSFSLASLLVAPGVITDTGAGKSYTITGTLAQVQAAFSIFKLNSSSGRIMAANSGSIYIRARTNLVVDSATDTVCIDYNDARIALYQYTSDQIRRKNVPQKSGSTP